MRDDLVAVKIEIDPRISTPPLRATERPAIESARGSKIVDRKGEMEGAQAHMVNNTLTYEIAKQGRKLRNHNDIPRPRPGF